MCTVGQLSYPHQVLDNLTSHLLHTQNTVFLNQFPTQNGENQFRFKLLEPYVARCSNEFGIPATGCAMRGKSMCSCAHGIKISREQQGRHCCWAIDQKKEPSGKYVVVEAVDTGPSHRAIRADSQFATCAKPDVAAALRASEAYGDAGQWIGPHQLPVCYEASWYNIQFLGVVRQQWVQQGCLPFAC